MNSNLEEIVEVERGGILTETHDVGTVHTIVLRQWYRRLQAINKTRPKQV